MIKSKLAAPIIMSLQKLILGYSLIVLFTIVVAHSRECFQFSFASFPGIITITINIITITYYNSL